MSYQPSTPQLGVNFDPRAAAQAYALRRLAQLGNAGLGGSGGLSDQGFRSQAQPQDAMQAWRTLSALLARKAHGAGYDDPRKYLRDRLARKRMTMRPTAPPKPSHDARPKNYGPAGWGMSAPPVPRKPRAPSYHGY